MRKSLQLSGPAKGRFADAVAMADGQQCLRDAGRHVRRGRLPLSHGS